MVRVVKDGGHMKYPLFLLYVDNVPKYLPLGRAGAMYDCGFVDVRIGDTVLLDCDGNVRAVTQADREAIREIADQCSASK